MAPWIESFRRFAAEHTLPLLQELVAAASINPPGNEDLAARPLAEFLSRHGVAATWQEVEPGRFNLIATVQGVVPGPTVALCSHLDVVPAGEPARWSSDPFAPRLDGDTLYGRGSCDAKGALAAMAVAIAFCARNPHPRGTIVLAAVCGEERGGIGAKFLVGTGFRADAAIIGEPTNLQVQLGHKGRIQATVRVHGTGGHASMPTAAVNPILRLADVLNRLTALSARIGARTHPLLGSASLAPTQISSSETNATTIPAMVSLVLDRRLLPSETHAQAAEEIAAALVDLPGVELDWFAGASPYLLDEAHPLVPACLRGVAAATGAPAIPGGFPATCDQYILGGAGIPTVILGPGDLVKNRTHAPDEFIRLTEVERSALAYTAAARAFMEV